MNTFNEVVKNIYHCLGYYDVVDGVLYTTGDLSIYDFYHSELPLQIATCRNFIIRNAANLSLVGFPTGCYSLCLEKMFLISNIDFTNTQAINLKIESCEKLCTISNINNSSLEDIYFYNNNSLKHLTIENTHSSCSIILNDNASLKIKNVIIKNKIEYFAWINCYPLENFLNVSINATKCFFYCNDLISFEGVELLKTKEIDFCKININTKNVSNLILMDANINTVSFNDITFIGNLLSEIVSRYAKKLHKKEHIMDFTLEMIDNSFELLL